MAGPELLGAAGPDRRFYAFVLDHLLVWSVYAVTGWAAYVLLFEPGHVAGGIALVVGVVVLVDLLMSLAIGLWCVSPGKGLLGLRVVSPEQGGPIGYGRALLRTTILGLATLPTLGIGTAALAWTAVADPTGRRRGWHDLRGRSVVVDARPPPPVEEPAEATPQPVVNLTAARLVPTSPTPPPPFPAPVPEPVVAVTPRQQLGWPLVGGPPGPPPTGPPHRPPPPPPPGQRTEPAPAAGTAPRWRVRFDTGETFAVAGLTLVGRRPEARQGEPVRQLVALPSEDMSLSKTHAQFQVVPDGALVVMDRGSTNGSILIRAGVSKQLTGGRPLTLRDGDRVRFGDREMTVTQDSSA